MVKKCRAGGNEWHHEVHREQVGLPTTSTLKFNDVKHQEGHGNDEGLAGLHTINPSKNVDGIGTKHGKHPHVHIVKYTCYKTKMHN